MTASVAGGNTVTFTANGGPFGGTGTTTGGGAVADALNTACAGATGGFKSQCDQIAALPPADQAVALNQIAPDTIAFQGVAGIQALGVQSALLGQRLVELRGGAGLTFGVGVTPVQGVLNRGAPGRPAAAGDTAKPTESGNAESAAPRSEKTESSGKEASRESSEEKERKQADGLPNLSGSSVASAVGGFIKGELHFGDRDTTEKEPGTKFRTKGLTFGIDYKFRKDLVAGLGVGYVADKSKFAADRGDVRTQGVILSGMAMFYPTEKTYLDAIISYGQSDYDSKRNIAFPGFAGTARGSTNGKLTGLSVGGGYYFRVERFSGGPYARLNYNEVDINAFDERGVGVLNLRIDGQRTRSFTSQLGGTLSYKISRDWGVLVPNVRIDWEHQYEDDRSEIVARFLAAPQGRIVIPTTTPDRNYFNLGCGVATHFLTKKSKIGSAFVFYQTVFDQDGASSHSLTAEFRLQF